MGCSREGLVEGWDGHTSSRILITRVFCTGQVRGEWSSKMANAGEGRHQNTN